VVDVAACCCAPTEELVAYALVVPVEAPKLEFSARLEEFEELAPKAALFVRLADAFRALAEFEDELPSLEWFELELPATPVPVVAVVEPLVPVVVEPFAPLVDGLPNEVLLLDAEVSFLFPNEPENSLAPAELEEPWLAFAPFVLAASVPEAARSSLALTAPLEELDDEDACCPPTDALCAKLSEVAVEAPKLELSFAPCAKLSDEDSLALWL
jgi:hypothetical protein